MGSLAKRGAMSNVTRARLSLPTGERSPDSGSADTREIEGILKESRAESNLHRPRVTMMDKYILVYCRVRVQYDTAVQASAINSSISYWYA